MKPNHLACIALLTLTAPVFAATPASGELTDVSGPQTFTGGPYLLPTPAGITAEARDVGCTIPQTCDMYALTVAIPEKFRKDKKNEKEVVQIVMSHSNQVPQLGATADIDLYLQDSAGNDIASSTGSTADEAISLPLKTLVDGNYTVLLITGLPLGSSETVEIRIGRGKSVSKQLVISPMVALPGQTLRVDASSFEEAAGYTVSFGDGESTTTADGIAEHQYASAGTYTVNVRNAAGKSLAMQPVQIDNVAGAVAAASGKSGSGLALGGFGLGALLMLAGFGLARRRLI